MYAIRSYYALFVLQFHADRNAAGSGQRLEIGQVQRHRNFRWRIPLTLELGQALAAGAGGDAPAGEAVGRLEDRPQGQGAGIDVGADVGAADHVEERRVLGEDP